MPDSPAHATAHARGRALEDAVAALFAAEGYRVRRNVLQQGRSGARHEVDVLAEREDGLIRTRVAVECKHWQAPVDTEVVARLRMLRDDLGVSEVVLVAPGGWTPAAGRSAEAAAVSLWGERELADRLGRSAVAALSPPPAPAPRAEGLTRARPADAAARLVRVHAGGLLGLARTRVEWDAAAWLPVHEVQVALTVRHGRLRPRLGVRRAHIGFDAVTGAPLAACDTPTPTSQVTLDAPVLPQLVSAAALADTLGDAMARRNTVTQEAARARHAATLARMLVDAEALDLRVEGSRTLFAPLHCALTRRGGRERLVVLDAAAGSVDDALSDALTGRLAEVSAALRGAA